uniref:Uncharacterized protein n=1 Tax=Trichobilharzia regenti TaxID=157069 RepID=A0AA85JKD4_TRIRE|nr:unnamed protein product [Trichobilharzia regenti]
MKATHFGIYICYRSVYSYHHLFLERDLIFRNTVFSGIFLYERIISCLVVIMVTRHYNISSPDDSGQGTIRKPARPVLLAAVSSVLVSDSSMHPQSGFELMTL